MYDPQQKTLLADKGEIRVGNRYQADITDLLKEGNFHCFFRITLLKMVFFACYIGCMSHGKRNVSLLDHVGNYGWVG